MRSIHIFLNSHCNYGAGRVRWKKISDEIARRVGAYEEEEIISVDTITSQVTRAYKNGARNFIAAGGDGTVNLLLNAIMTAGLNMEEVTLGAIGLGSSNDYHKPFRPGNMIQDIPVRLNYRDARLCDMLRIRYLDLSGAEKTRFCLCNASVGITAEANAMFNLRSTMTEIVQRKSVEAAIVVTALRTILSYHNLPCIINIDRGEPEEFMLSNLSVVKNPHFTGSLCYDSTIRVDDGKLGVYVCFNLSLLERIATFVALYRHRFKERPKTSCLTARYVSIRSDKVFSLEMDGEVVKTKKTECSVIPRHVRCCR